MISFRERLNEGILLFDGAMGTMLYNKGIFINQPFELVNLSAPHMVKEIHQEYIVAGSEVLETNTFGANVVRLKPYGLENSIYEINRKGAEIARDAAGDRAYIAGAVGPLGGIIEPLGHITREEAQASYRTQIQALVDGGVDLFIFETFYDLNELKLLIEITRELSDLPIIALGTFDEEGRTFLGTGMELFIRELDTLPVEAVGFNCSVGPATIFNQLEKCLPLTTKPFACLPNAGLPRQVEGRNIYLSTPEYMAEYAKRFIQSGARIIGGCCGTTPAHMGAMKSAIRALFPEKKTLNPEIISVESLEVKEAMVAEKSRLGGKLSRKEFVISVEITPPRSSDPGKVLQNCVLLKQAGVDAVNIPDGPRASARLSPLVMAILIEREAGLETVLHYCCRDRNIIGMQSDLLGAYAAGIRNILAITGDPPKLGDYPHATAVFDVDSIGLTRIISLLNRGLDVGKNPIGAPTTFLKGVGVNPGAIDLDEELRRFAAKVEAGAEFAITQPVYDVRVYERFLRRIEGFGIPVIAGIWPLVSYKNAEFMNNEVPGAQVPESVMNRMKQAGSGDFARAEGIKIAGETLQALQSGIAGVQVSAPFGRVETALAVLEAGGVAGG